MNSIEVIQERIRRVIRIEREITQRERDEFAQKKYDEEAYWGVGGNYSRFQKCQQKREEHLQDLDKLERCVGEYRPTEDLTLYPFYCPTCQMTTYLDAKMSRGGRDIVDCPVCNRTLFRSADSVTWETIKGSRRAKT